MIAKLTVKNQLTLPKVLVTAVGTPDYFEVEERDGQLILTPVRIQRADAVRTRLKQMGIDQEMVDEAVLWARKTAEPES